MALHALPKLARQGSRLTHGLIQTDFHLDIVAGTIGAQRSFHQGVRQPSRTPDTPSPAANRPDQTHKPSRAKPSCTARASSHAGCVPATWYRHRPDRVRERRCAGGTRDDEDAAAPGPPARSPPGWESSRSVADEWNLPAQGLPGNSHFCMLDHSSDAVADHILNWLQTAYPSPRNT